MRAFAASGSPGPSGRHLKRSRGLRGPADPQSCFCRLVLRARGASVPCPAPWGPLWIRAGGPETPAWPGARAAGQRRPRKPFGGLAPAPHARPAARWRAERRRVPRLCAAAPAGGGCPRWSVPEAAGRSRRYSTAVPGSGRRCPPGGRRPTWALDLARPGYAPSRWDGSSRGLTRPRVPGARQGRPPCPPLPAALPSPAAPQDAAAGPTAGCQERLPGFL